MPDAFSENFPGVVDLYDNRLNGNFEEQDVIYPVAYGVGEYIGQYSDNTASDLRRMARLMDLPSGSTVLDGGCGPGAVARLFAEEFGWEVRGVDISQRHLAMAIERGCRSEASERLSFSLVNLYDVGEAQPFDGAYGTGAWCHFDAERLFQKLHRLIRPGGRIGFMERVATGPIPPASYEAATRGWACPAIYSSEEYRRLLSASGFKDVDVVDLSDAYLGLQRAQIHARVANREALVDITSIDQYEESLALADAEYQLTEKGLLGYSLMTSTRD